VPHDAVYSKQHFGAAVSQSRSPRSGFHIGCAYFHRALAVHQLGKPQLQHLRPVKVTFDFLDKQLDIVIPPESVSRISCGCSADDPQIVDMAHFPQIVDTTNALQG
jgi:hypothetical protein